ncbi:Peptide methionine sulfoxide reductase MsrA [Chlamydiales bacterium SCGC AG-110-P3]|nr:Peptide methionine sulfoxide reductase MsrA [Chlamydiales bacterium SCGC AG-110-P3]
MRDLIGVISTRVGYTGGQVAEPTYDEVCTGTTEHAEAIEVIFDPTKTSYQRITEVFFEIHDPSQYHRQGPDTGSQYRSAVFYLSPDQKETATRLIQQLESSGHTIATELSPAYPFYDAEEYHQDYYIKSGKKPYCHVRTKRF